MLAELEANYNNINREGQTDDKGNAKEIYFVPTDYTNMGILQADFFTTVFDETGRPVAVCEAEPGTEGRAGRYFANGSYAPTKN